MEDTGFVFSGSELRRCLIQSGDVVIPEGVTLIGWKAFSGCGDVTSIHLPRSLTAIGPYAFGYCKTLREISVEEGNRKFRAVDGMLLEDTRLIACPLTKQEADVPAGTTELIPGLFAQHTALTRVSLPDTLVSIGENAFSGCTGLTSMFIPKNVRKIGVEAFQDCYHLTEIRVDAENKRYRSVDGMLFRNDTLIFCPPEKTGEAVIPEGTKKIVQSAFYGCRYLTDISIPDSVTAITTKAFYGCSGLRSLRFPSGLETIKARLCEGCTSLEEVIFPEGLTEIAKHAFAHTGLRRLELPASLKTVATSAFRDCKNLEELVIASSDVSIALDAFANCGLRRLTILGTPRLVPSAFTNCGPLETVIAGDLTPAGLPKGPVKNMAVVTFARRVLAGETPQNQDEYLKYIKNQRKSLFPLAVDHEELLHLMFAYRMITSSDIQPLLKAAENNVPVRAAVLDYQDKNGGPPDPFEELEKELARAERAAVRQEKKQKNH